MSADASTKTLDRQETTTVSVPNPLGNSTASTEKTKHMAPSASAVSAETSQHFAEEYYDYNFRPFFSKSMGSKDHMEHMKRSDLAANNRRIAFVRDNIGHDRLPEHFQIQGELMQRWDLRVWDPHDTVGMPEEYLKWKKTEDGKFTKENQEQLQQMSMKETMEWTATQTADSYVRRGQMDMETKYDELRDKMTQPQWDGKSSFVGVLLVLCVCVCTVIVTDLPCCCCCTVVTTTTYYHYLLPLLHYRYNYHSHSVHLLGRSKNRLLPQLLCTGLPMPFLRHETETPAQ